MEKEQCENSLTVTQMALATLTLSTWFLEGFTKVSVPAIQSMCDVLSRLDDSDIRDVAEKFGIGCRNDSIDCLQTIWTGAFCVGSSSLTPQESVVRTGLSMQEPRDQTLAWMRLYRCLPLSELHEPEDHIGLQAAFLGHLLLLSLNETDKEKASRLLSEAIRFTRERLAWVSFFREALAQKEGMETIIYGVNLFEILLSRFVNSNI